MLNILYDLINFGGSCKLIPYVCLTVLIGSNPWKCGLGSLLVCMLITILLVPYINILLLLCFPQEHEGESENNNCQLFFIRSSLPVNS